MAQTNKEALELIKANVKALLGLDETTDALVTMQVQGVIQKILNYCHIDTLPEGLILVATEMSVKAYNAWTDEGQYGYENVEGVVSSITRGDFSVTYDTNGQAYANIKQLRGDDILLDYRAQLNAYRRIGRLRREP